MMGEWQRFVILVVVSAVVQAAYGFALGHSFADWLIRWWFICTGLLMYAVTILVVPPTGDTK